jgi:predicted ribosome quality control (RQC) complex YloA/Tae2 family protein
VLSLAELRRSAGVLARELDDQRVQAVVQPDAHTLVITCYGTAGGGPARRRHLVLSVHPEAARVGFSERAPAAGGPPPGFAQYLRAHALGGRIAGVRLLGEDRQLSIRVRAERDLELLLAIFGRRSNLYALDAQGRIVACLRPLAETRPELELGSEWRSPSSPPRGGELDRFADVPDEQLLEAIELAYAETERESERSGLERRLAQALRREVKSVERKRAKLEQELAEAEAATDLERQGELLKSALGRISRGDREVVVKDWDRGEDVTIALDPLLAPAENLERLFKRYRKAVRALTKGGAQLAGVKEAREALAALEREHERALADEDPAALQAFAQREDTARLLAKYAPAPAETRARAKSDERRLAGRELPARFAPRRYRSEGGLEIWVGRSDAANDYLTTRLARGKDLFFHLDGAPGSHVILRTQGRDDPPSEAVLDACELAVHFSRQKNASRADVHVVPIKNVRKPRGAKPGLVVVHGGKSIHLRRSAARLERVLAARIE